MNASTLQKGNTTPEVLQLDLDEHGITFVLPPDGTLKGADLNLKGGALIQGHFSGRIYCEHGSLILTPDATFSGYAEADNVYIAGNILAADDGSLSGIVGRLMVSISSDAIVQSDVSSRKFSFNSQNLTGAVRTLA